MKLKRSIYTTVLAGVLLSLNISCGNQKNAAENRADTMNDDSKKAQENLENRTSNPESLPQTTTEMRTGK